MIHSNIEINASREKIWNILLDFRAYPEWNPFITEITGDAKIGSRLNVLLQVPGLKPQIFKPVVQIVWDKKKFCWLGRLGIPGLFDRQHMFILEELNPDETRFHQNEVFNGILVSLFGNVREKILAGFNMMNKALKERAEMYTNK